jgi:hypothetical protein
VITDGWDPIPTVVGCNPVPGGSIRRLTLPGSGQLVSMAKRWGGINLGQCGLACPAGVLGDQLRIPDLGSELP